MKIKSDKTGKEILPQEKYSLTDAQRKTLEQKTSRISTRLISMFFGLIPLIATAAIWIQQSGTKVSKSVSAAVLAVYCIGVALYIGYEYVRYGRMIAKMVAENKASSDIPASDEQEKSVEEGPGSND